MKNQMETAASVPTNQAKFIKAAPLLFIVNAVIWLLFGVISLVRISGNASQWITALVISVFMFGNVGAMLAAGIGIRKRNRWFFYFGIFVLLVNIILTFTDEFGIFDFITLAIDVVLLGILITNRSHYIPSLNR